MSTAFLRAQWSKPRVRLPLSTRLIKTFCCSFFGKLWLHCRSREETTLMCRLNKKEDSLHGVCFTHTAALWAHDNIACAEVNHRPSLTARGQTVCPTDKTTRSRQDYVGLEVPQKQTSVSATVNSFTTRSTLLWKLNLCSQIDGGLGALTVTLRKQKRVWRLHLCDSAAVSLDCLLSPGLMMWYWQPDLDKGVWEGHIRKKKKRVIGWLVLH